MLCVAAIHDPAHEMRKLQELYESLAAARREVGRSAGAVPQVRGAREVAGGEDEGRTGTPEVAFRVAVKDGKVNFTARALKGAIR